MRTRLGPERVSERRACRVLRQPRNTQRYQSCRANDELSLLREMRLLARQRPRFGSGRIHQLLTQRRWTVNENVSIDCGNESICKSHENNIASEVFLAEVKTVACVTVPATRIMCGLTTL